MPEIASNQRPEDPIPTPYYRIDLAVLRRNMATIAHLRERSGAKALLALKCFATWPVFDEMRPFLDGTTSSSLFEVRLGRERFGGETHAYSVAYGDDEIAEVVGHADKIIFNSIGQLDRFEAAASGIGRGLRLNPGVSTSGFDLADPARPFSRLGESDPERIRSVVDRIDGVMIHYNCENADFELFDTQLSDIEHRFADVLREVSWVSLGGGIHFTGEGYPVDRLADRLRMFADRFAVQVYLEPGEAAITGSATLEVTVLDVMQRGMDIAVVDSSIEAHLPDLLIYRESARLAAGPHGRSHHYMICGKSCLAGDVFGEFDLAGPLAVGDRLSFLDTAGYTMVKKNWFNGVQMPAIVVRDHDGTDRVARAFTYDDFESALG